MTRVRSSDEYFNWMYGLVCGSRFSKHISFRKLLSRLCDIEFRYIIPRDRNRADDGIDLRYRFTLTEGYKYPSGIVDDILNEPCSVLEMMIALSIRCEESIMDDPSMGDRMGQWFWGMIANLGLSGMTDDRFDVRVVDEAINRFLDREYEPNGKGGLFTIRDCDRDLRNVEIWYQLCWYLDKIM